MLDSNGIDDVRASVLYCLSLSCNSSSLLHARKPTDEGGRENLGQNGDKVKGWRELRKRRRRLDDAVTSSLFAVKTMFSPLWKKKDKMTTGDKPMIRHLN